MTKDMIINAYTTMKNDDKIPQQVLEFMKDAAIEKLDELDERIELAKHWQNLTQAKIKPI